MSDLVVRTPGPGNIAFAIEPIPEYQPATAEQAYIQRVNTLLADLVGADIASKSLSPEQIQERDEFIQRLRSSADVFVAKATLAREADAQEAIAQTYWLEGVYAERLNRVSQIPFSVTTLPEKEGDPVTDIRISIRDVPIPDDKQRLKVQIDEAVAVVKAVIPEREETPWPERSAQPRLINWLFRLFNLAPLSQRLPAAVRLDANLRALAGIARVGLMNLDKTQTPFAELALASFKVEFVAQEAGAIKK
jgi:hypothetical protein